MTPQQLGVLLKQGQISYDQYQQGMATINGVPAMAPQAATSVPAPTAAPAAPVADYSGAPPDPGAGLPADAYGPPAGSPAEAAQTAASAATAKAERPTQAMQAGAPPPPQGQPPIPAQPGQDPRDAMLGAFVSPRGQAATGAHVVGQSPADKEQLGTLAKAREEVARQAATTNAIQGDAVDAFKQNTDALATEGQIAKSVYDDKQKQDAENRAAMAAEYKERQTRIDGKLADLDAQGINPNKYWEDMGTGSKIGAAIAIGLGTFAAHPLGPHGESSDNTALSIIKDAIARNVDAQKANMVKSLDVLKERGSLDEQGFNRDLAMKNAERESYQTAYTVAQNDITKRMGMFRDNADFQQKGAALQAATEAAKLETDNRLSQEMYQIKKRGETVVGGAGGKADPAAAIRETAKKIVLDSKGQVSDAEALRRAAHLELGVDIKPGEPTTSWEENKGAAGGKVSPRLKGQLADLNEGMASANALLQSGVGGAGIHPQGATDRVQLQAHAGAFNKALHAVLGDEEAKKYELSAPGMVNMNFTDADKAKLLVGQQQMRRRIAALQAGGGGGEASDDPEALGLERDE